MNAPDLRLYLVVDPEQCGGRDNMPAIAAAAARGGVTLVQLRDKHAETGAFVAAAQAVKRALLPYRVPLLINDRVDVAQAVSAEGVHIGQKDMKPADARRLLGPGAIIGLTIQTEADVDGAPLGALDYACIGGVFPTGSKDNPNPPVGLDGLRNLLDRFAARGATFPIGAIAGINAGNAASVIEAGADGVALISAITRAADSEAASRDLRAIIDDALLARGAAVPALETAS